MNEAVSMILMMGGIMAAVVILSEAIFALEGWWHTRRCGGVYEPKGLADWRCPKCGRWR
jgi:tRNA(Ile2) C34 agmatinyltransferase TiaS